MAGGRPDIAVAAYNGAVVIPQRTIDAQRFTVAKTLSQRIRSEAHRLGFTQAAICAAVTPRGMHHLTSWLEAGYAGEMHYIAGRLHAYAHPTAVLEGAKSIVMLATSYHSAVSEQAEPNQGTVARYACGIDYHDVLRRRMTQLTHWMAEVLPAANARGVVDTAPLLEREFAQLAGLGWVGKNTMLLSRELGSYCFLSAVLLDQQLDYDAPFAEDYCGSCTACLDACPTGAFVAPYVLDSRRCISYLTIELRDEIPVELRGEMGNWVFGCDVCQEVCPWNQHAAQSLDREFAARPDLYRLDLRELFVLGEEEFRARFRATPLWRAKRRGLLRNAAIVLGNQRNEEALSALTTGLHDHETLVRGACAWALGQFETPQAKQHLTARLAVESEARVRDEIQVALGVTVVSDETHRT